VRMDGKWNSSGLCPGVDIGFSGVVTLVCANVVLFSHGLSKL